MTLPIEEQIPDRPEQAPARGPARSRDILLVGADADGYVERLVRAIDAARLNVLFPPVRRLVAHLSFLGPYGSRGVHPQLRVSRTTGLPTTREVLRVTIDRKLAADVVAGAAERRPPQPGSSLARRLDYYETLLAQDVMDTSHLAVDLRQHVPEAGLAKFRVVFDRFDLATGMFVRYTILLEQRHGIWDRRHVVIDDADLAAPTEHFRATVGRFTAHEAELAFVLLSQLEGIAVTDVRRCRVGPMLMPGVGAAGDHVEALMEAADTGDTPPWILCFPEDRAGVEVAAHSSGDPLSRLYREAVSEQSRELVDAKADQLGYRVAKRRKFVCPHQLREPLARLCRDLGAPSIVRGI